MGKFLRNRIWHYTKRTPRRFAHIEPRKRVDISLHTDSANLADKKVVEVEAQLMAFWEAKAAGRSGDDLADYEAAVRLAQARGYRYTPAADLSAGDSSELMHRLARLMAEYPDPSAVPREIAAADLGTVKVPGLKLSRLFQNFEDLTQDLVVTKSADQLRRWRNPRLRALANLIKVIGNKAAGDISRDDALEFRRWWWHRLRDEGLTPNAANKDFQHISAMLRTVSDMKGLGFDPVFSGLRFRESWEKSRHAFPVDWIRTTLATSDPLPGLNGQARDVLLVMVNTGARPSEISGLMADHIRLGDNIPHIRIRADGRDLKTPHSVRDIPLVGISLDAMRRHPNGFPRYRHRDAWSDAVNKFLRENDLLPGSGYSAYSLRHSFEDRLLAAGYPDRLAADLMGHATQRPKYGDGASLEQKLSALLEISI